MMVKKDPPAVVKAPWELLRDSASFAKHVRYKDAKVSTSLTWSAVSIASISNCSNGSQPVRAGPRSGVVDAEELARFSWPSP
jgi:hypothetical protein